MTLITISSRGLGSPWAMMFADFNTIIICFPTEPNFVSRRHRNGLLGHVAAQARVSHLIGRSSTPDPMSGHDRAYVPAHLTLSPGPNVATTRQSDEILGCTTLTSLKSTLPVFLTCDDTKRRGALDFGNLTKSNLC